MYMRILWWSDRSVGSRGEDPSPARAFGARSEQPQTDGSPNEREEDIPCLRHIVALLLLLVLSLGTNRVTPALFFFVILRKKGSSAIRHRRTTLFLGNGTLATVTSLRVGDFRSKHQPEDSASIARIYRS